MGQGLSAGTVNGWLESTFVNRPVWLQLHDDEDPGTNGASNIADIVNGRQLILFTRTGNGLVQPTGAPGVFVVDEEADDFDIMSGSLHSEAEGGTWIGNIIALSPTRVVGGDEFTVGAGMDFRISGWTI